MAAHSSTLAWEILWMEESGGLPSMVSHRFGHDWSDLAYIDMNQPWVYMCSSSRTPTHLPPHPILHGPRSAPALSALSHALKLAWWSISRMVIYMFQCCSLKSSYPRLLPQSPKVCSLHLCLFCCLAYRVIVTIFLSSIYNWRLLNRVK